LKYVEANASHLRWAEYKVPLGVYKGFRITSELGRLFAHPIGERRKEMEGQELKPAFEGSDVTEVKAKIDAATSGTVTLLGRVAALYSFAMRPLGFIYRRSLRLPLPLPPFAKALLGLLLLPVAIPLAIVLVPAPLIGKIR